MLPDSTADPGASGEPTPLPPWWVASLDQDGTLILTRERTRAERAFAWVWIAFASPSALFVLWILVSTAPQAWPTIIFTSLLMLAVAVILPASLCSRYEWQLSSNLAQWTWTLGPWRRTARYTDGVLHVFPPEDAEAVSARLVLEVAGKRKGIESDPSGENLAALGSLMAEHTGWKLHLPAGLAEAARPLQPLPTPAPALTGRGEAGPQRLTEGWEARRTGERPLILTRTSRPLAAAGAVVVGASLFFWGIGLLMASIGRSFSGPMAGVGLFFSVFPLVLAAAITLLGVWMLFQREEWRVTKGSLEARSSLFGLGVTRRFSHGTLKLVPATRSMGETSWSLSLDAGKGAPLPLCVDPWLKNLSPLAAAVAAETGWTLLAPADETASGVPGTPVSVTDEAAAPAEPPGEAGPLPKEFTAGSLHVTVAEGRITVEDTPSSKALALHLGGALVGLVLWVAFQGWQLVPLLPQLLGFSDPSGSKLPPMLRLVVGVVALLSLIPLGLMLASAGRAVSRLRRGGDRFLVDRTADTLVVNGRPAGRATEIRDVQVAQVSRSAGDSSASSYSYLVLLDLRKRKPLKLGGEQPDGAGAEQLGQAVAEVCGVPLRRTWGAAVTAEINSSD